MGLHLISNKNSTSRLLKRNEELSGEREKIKMIHNLLLCFLIYIIL